MIYLVWLSLMVGMIIFTIIGKKLNIIPIITQLLLAILLLPIVNYSIFPTLNIELSEFLNDGVIKSIYIFNFALLFGYILSDVIDLKYESKILKISIPSFFVPFIIGFVFSYYFFSHSMITDIAIGLLCAITAVPVLFIFLKNFNYNSTRSKLLVQVAIVIDILAWSILALAKSTTNIENLLIVLFCGLSPFILKYLIKNEKFFSIVFFSSIVLMEIFKLNSMLFGITFILSMAYLNIKFILPVKKEYFINYQNYFAVPYILIYGIIQVNYSNFNINNIWILFSFILIPMISKLIGNWLGFLWAEPYLPIKQRIKETFLLNTRGLTEIVFLNMLFQQNIINQEIYIACMLMGLISTLIPLFVVNKVKLIKLVPTKTKSCILIKKTYNEYRSF